MDGVSEWLKETKEAIKTSDALNDTIKTGMQDLWKSYETADDISSRKTQDAQLRSSPSKGEIACWNRCDELQMRYGGEGWSFSPLNSAQGVFDEAGFSAHYADICFGADFNHSPLNSSVVGWKKIYKTEQVDPLLSTQ